MSQQDLCQLNKRAQELGIEFREDELAFLVGFIESQVQSGLEEIERQIDEVVCDDLSETNQTQYEKT